MMHTSSLASAQLPVGSATLTFGPWAERFEHVRDRAVPTMRDDLFDDTLSGARHNFEVATGRADGAHQGPPSWTATSTSGSRQPSRSWRRAMTRSWIPAWRIWSR